MVHGILANKGKGRTPLTSGSQTLAYNAVTWKLVRKANDQVEPQIYRSETLGVLQPHVLSNSRQF